MTSTSITVVWDPPGEPNGVLLHYIIYQNGTEIQRVMGNVTSYVVTGLQPFSVYVFKLGVCTKEGCSNSSDSTPQRTLESGMSSFIRLTCDCISAINHRFLRLTPKDIIPTMSHNSAETLRSKIRFSSFLEHSTPPDPFSQLVLICLFLHRPQHLHNIE